MRKGKNQFYELESSFSPHMRSALLIYFPVRFSVLQEMQEGLERRTSDWMAEASSSIVTANNVCFLLSPI